MENPLGFQQGIQNSDLIVRDLRFCTALVRTSSGPRGRDCCRRDAKHLRLAYAVTSFDDVASSSAAVQASRVPPSDRGSDFIIMEEAPFETTLPFVQETFGFDDSEPAAVGRAAALQFHPIMMLE
ncbi:hypothetical protein H257_14271 [Aphanomyces astaci]|uniref:Uncharacterized protein n=1 Tax=Aphanomyces astaci TaxID=112090 RepID=W4FRZ1_APHAT|nr:hypothetical protein H257_14271 [Aphanomyces astaci]ETV70247.1 hypothetical protein H257_14271 [Aphanomyces astaci]|eukprot:XP_009840343.1 hypothetical protein H257_14271 [Aphanomyces astaci]